MISTVREISRRSGAIVVEGVFRGTRVAMKTFAPRRASTVNAAPCCRTADAVAWA